MKEALSQRWQNPPLDTVMTCIQLVSHRPISITSVFVLLPATPGSVSLFREYFHLIKRKWRKD